MTRHGSLSRVAPHRSHRALPGLLAGVALALLLAACGQTTGPSAGYLRATGHDRGDATFARTMMARDGQAQMMEGWVAGRTTSTSVRALASRMMRTQGGWDDALRACVRRWSGSAQAMMGSPGHGPMMGSDEMRGMISRSALTGLEAASGPAFDRMYLTMMVRHHTSMVALVAAEAARGSDPAVVRLARRMRRTQNLELAQLRRLLHS